MVDTILAILAWVASISAHPVPTIPEDLDPWDPLAVSQWADREWTDIPPRYITDTCYVESGCRRAIGVHPGDAWAGRVVLARVRSHRRASICWHYRRPPPRAIQGWQRQWSTTGVHGLMTGYNLHYVGNCLPLWSLRVPLVSAIAAARKAQALCARIRRRGDVCTSLTLRREWAGGPNTDRIWARRRRNKLLTRPAIQTMP